MMNEGSRQETRLNSRVGTFELASAQLASGRKGCLFNGCSRRYRVLESAARLILSTRGAL